MDDSSARIRPRRAPVIIQKYARNPSISSFRRNATPSGHPPRGISTRLTRIKTDSHPRECGSFPDLLYEQMIARANTSASDRMMSKRCQLENRQRQSLSVAARIISILLTGHLNDFSVILTALTFAPLYRMLQTIISNEIQAGRECSSF